MTFENFTSSIIKKIKEQLVIRALENHVAETNAVTKNNDEKKIGVVIRDTTKETQVSPTIYLEDFYKYFEENGEEPKWLDVIANKILYIYIEHQSDISDIGFKPEDYTNFASAKDSIFPRLINAEANKERLANIPHKLIGDLAVIYTYILKHDDGNEIPSITLQNNIFKKYGITLDELHDLSVKNLHEKMAPSFKPVSYVLGEMMIPGFATMTEEEKQEAANDFNQGVEMYVLTNKEKIFGASVILDEEFMKTITEKIPNCIIIPSSVHELLVLNASPSLSRESLTEMIQDVNANCVQKTDYLSDHPYIYNSVKKELVSMQDNDFEINVENATEEYA